MIIDSTWKTRQQVVNMNNHLGIDSNTRHVRHLLSPFSKCFHNMYTDQPASDLQKRLVSVKYFGFEQPAYRKVSIRYTIFSQHCFDSRDITLHRNNEMFF